MDNFFLSRNDLSSRVIKHLRIGKSFQPHIFLVQDQGRTILVKDYAPTSFLIRTLVGPFVIGREFKIYRTLQGLPGIPKVYGKIDKLAFAMEYLGGKELYRFGPGEVPEQVFVALRQLVEACHRRGVVHGDLGMDSNVLVSDELLPYIIDFSSAIVRGKKWNPLITWLWNIFQRYDLNSVRKLAVAYGKFDPFQERDRESLSKKSFLEEQLLTFFKKD